MQAIIRDQLPSSNRIRLCEIETVVQLILD